ncbi:uncharacterized protein LOC126902667 [Daktulosphaira vitifoliae]|uniref:uncharacterized protein LOC126902667 n=1 Tax=Daktulosphaira vitifoliae TaxID=58002 RepID=UPI0021AAEDA2|nr:uncharacterized protein LOC126902667 [Daktulosphaira vitifoliae]XP_050536117.1 uncharacterized protein LOC126902667 [Daktulosphaira vitifoliae]
MSTNGQHYCLRWNNYQSNMTSVFHQLLRNESFVDVTLACNESTLKAHKVVLSACSSYFQKLLMDNPCKHPTIILPYDICFSDLKFIIEFVYRGEIDVSQAELQSLLRTADQLKIRGLCEVPEDERDSSITAEVTPLGPLKTGGRVFTKLQRRTSPYIKKLSPNTTGCFQSEQYSRNFYRIEQTGFAPICINQENKTINSSHCMTVATSTEEDEKEIKSTLSDLPVVILDPHSTLNVQAHQPQIVHMNMPSQQTQINHEVTQHQNSPQLQQSSVQTHTQMIITSTPIMTVSESDITPDGQPVGPRATPVPVKPNSSPSTTPTHRDMAVGTSSSNDTANDATDVKYESVKFETLRTIDQTSDAIGIDRQQARECITNMNEEESSMHTMMITPELLGLLPSSSNTGDVSDENSSSNMNKQYGTTNGKGWTTEDMENALEALRSHNMSLTKASITFGIPSTTLWQRAHRAGIDTPKKDGPAKSWNDDALNVALDALRTGTISANKASKAYGIPSSTLYKIARREGIRLAAPFNAAPTSWGQEQLDQALHAIRTGQTTVQKAAADYGIPSGTLYGRCKREKIELSRSNPTPWSEDAMMEALESVRLGQMSINQAAIHYNLPYSSLYGRFKRIKYGADHPDDDCDVMDDSDTQNEHHQQHQQQHQHQQHQQQQQHQHQHQHQQQQQQQVTQQVQATPMSQIMLVQYPAPTQIQMYQQHPTHSSTS